MSLIHKITVAALTVAVLQVTAAILTITGGHRIWPEGEASE